MLTQQTQWSNQTLRYHTNEQAVGPCPFCPDHGDDRFVVFIDGNYYCRRCERRGWWKDDGLDKTTIAATRLVKEQDRIKRREAIANCKDWITYNQQAHLGLTEWKSFGIDETDIMKWGLGFCKQSPCCDYPSASLTIPVYHHGTLVDIRHRLLSPQNGQKYRSHWPGLPPSFFNIDSVKEGGVVFVVEGEKKAVVLEHYGFHPTISFPGLNNGSQLPTILSQECTKSQQIVFLPDPGSEAKMRPLFQSLRQKGFRVSVVDLFKKPDDWLMEYGPESVRNALKWVL